MYVRETHVCGITGVAHPLGVGDFMGSILGPNLVIAKDLLLL